MIRIGVIGCGQRMRNLCSKLAGYDGVAVTALYDPSPEQVMRFSREVRSSAVLRICSSWQELAGTDVDWVMIGSPNVFHASQAVACLEAGNHVFLEKPLAVSRNQCSDIISAWKSSGKKLVTGFVLRWSPLYRCMKDLMKTRNFGKVTAIQANENISYTHGSYIMKNWRRWEELSGPFILEKCVHDLDLLQWMAGSPITRIAALSGKSLFTGVNRDLLSGDQCSAWNDKGNVDAHSPFGDEPGRVDDHTLILALFASGVKGQFMTTAGSVIPERRILVSCLRGTLAGELYSGTLRFRTLDMDHEETYSWESMGLHGGGDDPLTGHLYRQMTGGNDENTEVLDAVNATLSGIAAGEASVQGSWVDVSPYGLNE